MTDSNQPSVPFTEPTPEEKKRWAENARELWISTALDPWCKRHGLTRKQGLSVAFDDSTFDPKNPEKDQVTLGSLFAWSGQQNDFASYLMWGPGAPKPAAAAPVGADQAILSSWRIQPSRPKPGEVVTP